MMDRSRLEGRARAAEARAHRRAPAECSRTDELWARDRVVVTGGAGFPRQLRRGGAPRARRRGQSLPRRANTISIRCRSSVERLYRDAKPDWSSTWRPWWAASAPTATNPGRFFYDNLTMGVQLMERRAASASRSSCQVGTICAYPKFTPVPFHEDDLWNGYPEETNAPYGMAKKMLLVSARPTASSTASTPSTCSR